MTQIELYKKAIRLCEGGIVECNLHCVRLKVAPENSEGCEVCEMDSICRMEMADLCSCAESILRKACYLELVANDL